MKKTLLLATMLASVFAAHATIYTTNWNSGFANAGVVPDNGLAEEDAKSCPHSFANYSVAIADPVAARSFPGLDCAPTLGNCGRECHMNGRHISVEKFNGLAPKILNGNPNRLS